jgi:hypothetical protein
MLGKPLIGGPKTTEVFKDICHIYQLFETQLLVHDKNYQTSFFLF